ncbi:MAG TPA: alpha-glucosidase, partial [Spirochaetia bacterium]|nr:alpha-glucosidase [Spirochaetia bacterium]
TQEPRRNNVQYRGRQTLWWKNGVLYQIYPRSFMDSNADGVGDLRGIIEKLDYLNDGTGSSLGIDGIWFSPFFRSPMRDFGYDISDYRDIDPIFGTLDDFKELLREAHRRNIRVIIDLVLNHTSDQHPWFQESRQSREGPRADWYLWHSGRNGRRPNNWFSQFELKNAWWYEPLRRQYYLGTFTRHQPEVNWRNPDLRKEMVDLVRYWLDMGVDGFRLDAVNWFVKDQQFRSNPLSFRDVDLHRHVYDRNRPETIDICRELRRLTDSYPDRMMVGEVYDHDPDVSVAYYGSGNDALHLVFYFDLLFQPWSAEKIAKSLEKWYSRLPASAWPTFTLSNHDNLRHAVRYRAGRWTDARARVAAALLLTLRGTPFLYYGEELGMSGGKLRKRDLVDPLSRKTWPFRRYRRDLARTPMQWDGTPHAGFTVAKPWLPVDPSFTAVNVEAQSGSGDSLLGFYKKLIQARKKHPALAEGEIHFLPECLPRVLAYTREQESRKVLVALNFTQRRLTVKVPGLFPTMKVLLGSRLSAGAVLDPHDSIEMGPYEVLIAGQGAVE